MFPKTGKVFPGGNDRENGRTNYATMIATALRTELGDTHRATKTLMQWTGAGERTVKHWLSGVHGPGGEHLLVLMRESEAVFEAVLTAAGRLDAISAVRVLQAHGTMVEVMAMVGQERAGHARMRAVTVEGQGGDAPIGADDPENDRVNDLENDPVNSVPDDRINPRQRWFLEGLASGRDVRAADLRRRSGVSDKTARRDVAILKVRGMIEFVGSFRTGRYRVSD